MRFSVATVFVASAALVAAVETYGEEAPSGYGALAPSSTESAPVSPESTPAGYGEATPSTTVSATSTASSYATESTVSVTASSYETVPSVTSSAPVSPETTGECPAPETVTVTVTVGDAECGTSTGVVPPYPTGTETGGVPTGYPTGTAPGTAPGSTGTASSYPSSTVVPFEGAGANVKASFGLGAVAAVAALFL